MKKLFTLLALATFIGLPISTVLAHDQAGMQSSAQAEQQPFDIQFLDTMAMHHEEGIKMFNMASNKAQSSEVKSMAQKMAADQKKEIPELRNLREKIKKDAPEAVNMNLSGMGPMDMSKLENASEKDFDRVFLNMTIKHHEGAVAMSDMALKKSQNPDIKAKAQMMHDKQKDEIAQMQKMLKQ